MVFENIGSTAYSNGEWLPGFGADVEPSVVISKIGKNVTLVVPGFTKADGGEVTIEAGIAIPSGYRPAVAIKLLVIVSVNAVISIGYAAIGTDGSLEIFADLDGAAFTDNVAVGVEAFSVTYIAS